METLKKKKYFSIKTKITFSIVIFVLITFGIIFTASFLNTKKVMRDDLRLRLLNMVSISVMHVDVANHMLLKNPEDESSDAYIKIKKDLQDVRNSSTDISYIYTLRENDKKQITFIVDAEENPDEVSHLGSIYDDANQFLLDNFLTINAPITEKDFTSDKWGTWISGYAPFYDKDGNRQGVLGIDISASSVVEKENKILYLYILTFFGIGLFSILLGIYLSNKIINSITYLTKAIKSNDINLAHSNDEVGELADVLKTKLDQVNMSQEEASVHNSNNIKMLEKMNKLMIGRELEMIKLKKENAELKKNISSPNNTNQ